MRTFYVYILSNKSATMYTGITNDLPRRVFERKTGSGGAFTAKYHVTQLVYYEIFASADDAIVVEKRIKGWSRAKKVALIESRNPSWVDLSEGWMAGSEADALLENHVRRE